MKTSRIFPSLALVVCVVLSLIITLEINSFLGISSFEKILPEVPTADEIIHERQEDPISKPKKLPLRIADFGSVGVIPDADNWGDDYSHNLRHLEKVLLPHPPYINNTAFAQAEEEFKEYVDLLASYGINGLIVPFLLEFINFDRLEDGNAIYDQNNAYRHRQLALRNNFKRLFEYARQKGVDIFLYSDMVILSPPLQRYLERRFGSLDTGNPAFWEVYKKGLEELFVTFPEVKGIYIRIGEAGSIYNMEGWDYKSELLVDTGTAVRNMLTAFLEVAEEFNKLVVFRTWSVGVGEIGDMHTNPETYNRILESIQSENLIVSTKYCNGDYYSFIPLNRTLYQGRHKRIIEFQARREFEGFNAFPLYLGPLYQEALLSFLERNQTIEGIWLWTQYGGPLRAGPLSLYPFHGFNVVTDLNVAITSMLAQNPSLNIRDATETWVKAKFGNDPEMVSQLSYVLLSSFEIMKKGLYISQFARKEVKALGLLPPPMLWIFEWDIVTAANSVLSSIYHVSKESVGQMVAEGEEAIVGSRLMKRRLLGVENRIERNREEFHQLLLSIDYEIDLFDVLASYRAYFLNYYFWIETGDNDTYLSWTTGLKEFLEKEKRHTEKYGTDLDFPAFNFSEAKIGARLAGNSLVSRNLAIAVIIADVILFLIGIGFIPVSKRYAATENPLKTLALPFRKRPGDDSPPAGFLVPVLIVLLTIVVGTLSLTGFSAGVTTITICGFLLTYLILLFLFLGRKRPTAVFLILSPIVCLFLVYLVISGIRGPGLLWFYFWTNEGFRIGITLISAFLTLWSYVVLYASCRKYFRRSVLMSFSIVILIQGIQFLLLGIVTHFATLEASITAVNDELAILPGGLSRILGITTHLNIPTTIPLYVLYAGLVLTVCGFVLRIAEKRLTR